MSVTVAQHIQNTATDMSSEVYTRLLFFFLVPESGKYKIKVLAAPRSGKVCSLVMRQRLGSRLVEGPVL